MNINNLKFVVKAENFFTEIARSKIVLQALLVGLISGLLVVLFRVSITVMFNQIHGAVLHMSLLKQVIIFPLIAALGGLIAGVLVFKFAPETQGSGIPFVKLTLARVGRGTRIRSIFVKFFAGVAGIGTGLSLGREGPSVQLGSGAGALVAKMFKSKGTEQDELIAAGAGAAIGATFNAPIAGTIFVLEELIQGFSSSLLFPVLVATVTASTLARWFLGSNPSFKIPPISIPISQQSIPVFIVLGIAAGILGVLFAKNIFNFISLFAKLKKIPNWTKPAIAGYITALVGVFLPYILSAGNDSVDLLLQHKFQLGMVALIFVGKFFITPLCFGSGAAGGIFLPMLMLGSFLGYFIGLISNYLGVAVDPVVISLVGMGAFLAAVARAPITAVVIVFEMTGDYTHILPIMLSAAIADIIAEKLNHAPIFSSLIFKRGSDNKTVNYLSSVKVKEYMTIDVEKFSPELPLHKVLEVMDKTHHGGYPVVAKDGYLLGIITRADVENAFLQGNSANSTIEKFMNPHPPTINTYNNLYMASLLLHSNNTGWLSVLDKNKSVAGIITRYDINQAIKKREEKN